MCISKPTKALLQMATFPNAALVFLFHLLISTNLTAATWCVARNDATADALQKALDYACGFGADCEPIQESGECFLPNTLQAHASFAFNSFYMRSSMATAACDFSGTATVAKTDPSYGSCIYPASPSISGGMRAPPVSTVPSPPLTGAPILTSPLGATTPPPPQNGSPLGDGVLTPGGNATPLNGSSGAGALAPAGMEPTSDSFSSAALHRFSISVVLSVGIVGMSLLLILLG